MTDVETFSALTLGSVLAGSCVAHVDSRLTVFTSETISAATSVVIDTINTHSSVHAGGAGAVVIILGAVSAGEATGTGAGEGVDIVLADGAVLAGVAETLVHVLLAVLATEPWRTNTLVVSNSVQTCSTIETRVLSAVISVQETISSLVSTWTLTRVASVGVDTRGSILARLSGGTLVNVQFTPGAVVSKRTSALELLIVAIG